MSDMRHPRFVRAVKKAMKEKDLSLRALSRETDIDLSFLSRILSGDRNPPSDSYIIKIAKALDLNADQLVVDAGRIPDRLFPLIDKINTTMENLFTVIGDDFQDIMDRALNRFFSTKEGQKWFNDHYIKPIHIKNNSFIAPAFEYYSETSEGKRWLKNEFKKLEKRRPEMRTILQSFDKWPIGR